MTKVQTHSWEVTDEFRKRMEPLVPQPAHDPTRQYKRVAESGPPSQASPIGIRGDHVCAAHGLPVEGSASRSFWQRQRNPPEVHVVAQDRVL